MDGAVTQMCYAGDLLVSERTGSEKTLWYRYDSSGNVIALTYESEIYMYLRNAQNDIIGLLDKDGKVVVRYTYDSWGQVGVMSRNERNPYLQLLTRRGEDSEETAGDNSEEGGDDVKSSCPL